VEIQVRKIYCVNRAAPVLPISIDDAARSEAEIENALEHGEQLVRVNNSGHPVELQGLDVEMEIKGHYSEVMDIVDSLFVDMFNKINEECEEAIRKQYPFKDLKDSSGMLSLLSTLEQSLKSGKKHALHATSVTNVCVGLLSGLKSILAEGGICESQRRASSDRLGLLARLGNDMFTVRFGCCDRSFLPFKYGDQKQEVNRSVLNNYADLLSDMLKSTRRFIIQGDPGGSDTRYGIMGRKDYNTTGLMLR
ncbi:protein SWEETIE isoform X1, partial [Tanacetum coccineum]